MTRSLPEYDDANPSRDPSHEPRQKRVTIAVYVEVPDMGDDRDTLHEAERALRRVLDEGEIDYDLEAIEIEDT